jgi:S-formylglutathione hydrolase
MGGHGALISGLKTKFYKSLSAFAPISHPTKSLWGSQAF